MDNLLALSQIEILKSSLFIVLNTFFMFLLELNNLLSSANIIGATVIEGLCKSFM